MVWNPKEVELNMPRPGGVDSCRGDKSPVAWYWASIASPGHPQQGKGKMLFTVEITFNSK